MSFIKTIVSLAVLGVVGGILFVWFGIFNVAATSKHWDITTEILELALDRSIAARSQNISVPPDITDKARIERGAANYDEMCSQCHLAPGVETSELHQGLYPQPPVLYKDEEFPGELVESFWVIKNGIKMTGMPAWLENNSDEQIWDMVAFIAAMIDSNMTPEQYQAMVDSGMHTHKEGGHMDGGSAGEQETGQHMGTDEEKPGHDEADSAVVDPTAKEPTAKDPGHHDGKQDSH